MMGLSQEYGGPFFAVSMLIMMASFSSWGSSTVLAADLEGARSISYELSLPSYYWLIFVKYILSFAFQAALFNLTALVIGKLLFFKQFDLSQCSIPKFIILYSIACIFFGTFSVWAAMFAGAVHRHRQLEIRLAGPLFFICGYGFPWFILNQASSLFALLMLATPWIYAYEGVRASIFGQSHYINFWICCGMLIVFTIIFGFMGLRLFKKRLDCV